MDAQARLLLELRELMRANMVEIEAQWLEEVAGRRGEWDGMNPLVRESHLAKLVSAIVTTRIKLDDPQLCREGIYQLCARLILYTHLLMAQHKPPEGGETSNKR